MKGVMLAGGLLVLLLADPIRSVPRSLPTVRQTQPLADTLRSIAYRMARLLRERNTQGVVELYGDTLRFVHIDNGNVVPWSVLSPMMRGYLDSVTSNPIAVAGEPGVIIMDQDNAVLYITHRFGGGSGRETHEGVWTGVLHRFPQGWRIVHSHSSDREP